MPVSIYANTWNGGTDTEWRSAGTNAYYIDTAEELAGLASKVNSGTTYSGYTFYLTSNLNLNGSSHNWNPIGYFNGVPGGSIKSSENYFSGTFNGQGYTISNYSASYDAGLNTGKITVGLFGAIRNATIENLQVTNSYVYVKSNAFYVYGGTITGWMDNGSTIKNCSSYNNTIHVVAKYGLSGRANAGGICGSAENSTAQNCSVYGNSITADGSKSDNSNAISNNYSGATLSSNTVYSSVADMTSGIAQKAQAQNNQIHMWNNWGAGTKPTTGNDGTHYYMLDESTGTPTSKIYLAVDIKAADAASVSKEANITISNNEKISYTYNGTAYNLYLKGSTVTAEFYPLGYKGDWTDHGNYVNFGSDPAIVNNLDVYENNRYERKQTVSQTLSAPIISSYGVTYTAPSTAENMTEKVRAINRSTIIYNNFGADAAGAVEPKTPYFIDESTWRPTTNIYYAYTGITDVENVTSAVSSTTEALFYDGIEYPLYNAGQDIYVNIKYTLPGYKGDWTDHGCYVDAISMNGNTCEIFGTTISNNISEEGYNGERYARSQDASFKITMPEAPVSFTYTTAGTHAQAEDVTEAVKAINRSTIIYNNFGADAEGAAVPKTKFFIDEETFKPTDKIYYTYKGITDAENITSEVSITSEAFEYGGYSLYYAGQELDLNVKYNLPGYKGDWTDHGCYVDAISANDTECEIASTTISSNISEEGYNGERYARTQEAEFSVVMPEAPMTLAYTTTESHTQAEDVTEAVKAINRATIIYNNFGADAEGAVEPKTKFFINEETFKPTDKIYYTYAGITDAENITSEVTIATEAFEYGGYSLYYAGQELDLNVKFDLPGYKGDWTDHGCYVDAISANDTECEITSTTISNNISEEGYNGERYARTQEAEFSAVMPDAPMTLAYTTAETKEHAEDVTEAVKAINNSTIIYNNFGAEAEGAVEPKTPYFIDEATLKPTQNIYYAVTFYNDFKNMRDIPVIKASELAKSYKFKDVDYTLYPAGSEITIESYPVGYNTDWSASGYYLFAVAVAGSDGMLQFDSNSIQDDLQNSTDSYYHRTQTTTVKLPGTNYGYIMLCCYTDTEAPENTESNDITEAVVAINRATIIYNNWGVGEEPATPYYIDEETFEPTDKIYYAFEPSIVNPEDEREATGVRDNAEYVHSESMQTFTYNDIEYPLYANGDVVGIKCYLDGYDTEMDINNEGWKVAQVNECNADAWEISEDPEYAEIITDITDENGYDSEVDRFCREHTVFVTVPLVTEMRKQPISLTYSTAGTIKDNTATYVEDITDNATYAHGVITCDGMIEVYNINGVLVAYKKNQVNINELNNGIYFVRCGNKTMKILR